MADQGESITRKAGAAALLLAVRKIWGGVVNLAVMAYLARTLDKSDFGIVAISGMLITFIQTAGLSGLSEYLVFNHKEDETKVRNAVFWLNACLGLGVAMVVMALAPFWASVYQDTRILKVLAFLLVGFIFSTLSQIPMAIFRKQLEYRSMVKIQAFWGTVAQGSQAAFAFAGFGVYSLVIPNALITPLLAVSLFYRSGFRPDWSDRGTTYWPRIIRYTKHVIGARILGKFANEGDTLLIGRLLGMDALGIYDIAYRFANMINLQILPIITNISLPVFARTDADFEKLRSRYLKMIRLIGVVLIPLYGLLFALADGIVWHVLGESWTGAVLPFRILLVFALFRAISSPSSGLFNALGRPEIGFRFTLFFVPVFLASVAWGAGWGIIGACITVTVARVLGGMVQTGLALRLIGLKYPIIIQKIGSLILISVVCTSLTIMLLGENRSLIALAAAAAGFTAWFILLLRLLARENLHFLSGLIRELNIGRFAKRPKWPALK